MRASQDIGQNLRPRLTAGCRAAPATAGPLPRWPSAAGVALTLVGLGLASYLTWAHYQPNPRTALACSTGGVVDCGAVTTSSYATVAHVPVALAGLVYFVVMLALQLPAAWRAANPWLHRARLAWVTIGTLSVFWLVYVELIKLDRICEYCTGVHLVTIALFAVTALGTASLEVPEGAEADESG